MLTVFLFVFSGIQTTIQATVQVRDVDVKNGLDKPTTLLFTAILGEAKYKEDLENMIDIWEECARFITSQRLANQALTIIKFGLLTWKY